MIDTPLTFSPGTKGIDAIKTLLEDARARLRDIKSQVDAAASTLARRRLKMNEIELEVRWLESDLAALTRDRSRLTVVKGSSNA